MYPRQTKGLPVWLVVITAMLVVFGGYYLWHGVMSFFESNGNIAAPATNAVINAMTATSDAMSPTPPSDFLQIGLTTTPPRVCYEFRVKPARARVRECPKDSCNTITMPPQGMVMCVYGPAKEAPDWYEINIDATQPIPQLAYMHNSVIEPINPTKQPTRTFTPLPTVSPVPSITKLPSSTPPPTNTPNPAAPATWTRTPTPTRFRLYNRPDPSLSP